MEKTVSTDLKAIADFLASDYEREIPTTVRVLEAVPTGRRECLIAILQKLVQEQVQLTHSPAAMPFQLGLMSHPGSADRPCQCCLLDRRQHLIAHTPQKLKDRKDSTASVPR